MKLCTRALILGSVLTALSGCSGMYTTSIASPARGVVPPSGAPSVTLSVSDQRPANEGGKDPRRVGTIRALAGNGAGMREESPDAVRRLVEVATVDGLAASGVASAPGQPATLEVGVRKFWMDGYASYTAEMEGTLSLKKDGAVIWTRALKATATGEQPRSASEMFNRVWGWTLDKWRDEVARAAAEPAFLAALGARLAVTPAPVVTAASAVSASAEPKPAAAGPVGLSVSSEFGIDDRQQLSFQIRSREALKRAGLEEKRGAFPEVAVRYTAVYEKNQKNGKVNGCRVSTRLALKDSSGRILFEDSFRLDVTLPETDPKETNYLAASLGLELDLRWVPEIAKRLGSAEFRKAAGR